MLSIKDNKENKPFFDDTYLDIIFTNHGDNATVLKTEIISIEGFDYLKVSRNQDNIPYNEKGIGNEGSYLSIEIKLCQNNTDTNSSIINDTVVNQENQKVCKSREEIFEKLNDLSFYASQLNWILDTSERKFNPEFITNTLPVTEEMIFIRTMDLKYTKLKYITPLQQMFFGKETEIEKVSYVEYNDKYFTRESVGDNDGYFGMYLARFGIEHRKYDLAYSSVTSVLGGVYGIIESFFAFGSFIMGTLLGFLENNYYYKIISTFFDNVTTKNHGRNTLKRISFTNDSSNVIVNDIPPQQPKQVTSDFIENSNIDKKDEQLVGKDKKKDKFNLFSSNKFYDNLLGNLFCCGGCFNCSFFRQNRNNHKIFE